MQRLVRAIAACGFAVGLLARGIAGAAEGVEGLDKIYPELDALYLDLHQSPELSLQEEKTAGKMAARLRALGFEVTTGVGKHGVVGVLRNGKGPTVLLRTDMDGLPVLEKTGLPYASKVTARRPSGETVPVTHACGHDIHMSAWVGAATLLARARGTWSGTLVMVGQPAEEVVAGAAAMLADGLYERFPRPDYALAVHDHGLIAAGQIGVVPGFALASMDTVEITVYGKGGHGAAPHMSVDPIVIAARIVGALQTIVAREVNPRDPAVVTVGSFHAGTKANIIPDEAKLQLTVRSYKRSVRDHLLAAIARIARAEAAAANAPREPLIWVDPHGSTETVLNDEKLVAQLRPALEAAVGKANVVDSDPIMGSEDFSEFRRAGTSAALFWIGATEPGRFAELKSKGEPPPSVHSALFAPDRERTIRTGVITLVTSALALLGKGGKG